MLLGVKGLTKRFAGLVAVMNIDFKVQKGEILGLIGPNGAGKTTIFSMISGFLKPTKGDIFFDGRKITGLSPPKICHLGVTRTFQLVKPLSRLTVLENVMVGALQRRKSLPEARLVAGAVLERLDLAAKAEVPAHSLTLPERKRLEAARALATGPKLLLLDEVMAGLRPTEIDVMVRCFADLARETGLAILLTEHVMRAVMTLSHHIVVLHHGRKICEGTPERVARDPAVLQSYLGGVAP